MLNRIIEENADSFDVRKGISNININPDTTDYENNKNYSQEWVNGNFGGNHSPSQHYNNLNLNNDEFDFEYDEKHSNLVHEIPHHENFPSSNSLKKKVVDDGNERKIIYQKENEREEREVRKGNELLKVDVENEIGVDEVVEKDENVIDLEEVNNQNQNHITSQSQYNSNNYNNNSNSNEIYNQTFNKPLNTNSLKNINTNTNNTNNEYQKEQESMISSSQRKQRQSKSDFLISQINAKKDKQNQSIYSLMNKHKVLAISNFKLNQVNLREYQRENLLKQAINDLNQRIEEIKIENEAMLFAKFNEQIERENLELSQKKITDYCNDMKKKSMNVEFTYADYENLIKEKKDEIKTIKDEYAFHINESGKYEKVFIYVLKRKAE